MTNFIEKAKEIIEKKGGVIISQHDGVSIYNMDITTVSLIPRVGKDYIVVAVGQFPIIARTEEDIYKILEDFDSSCE